MSDAQLSDVDYRSIDRDEHWLMVMSILVEIAGGADDREMMEWMHGALLPFADLISIHDLMRAGRGSVNSSLGVLAAGLGDLDAAIECFERAIEKEEAADMRPGMLVSQLGLARTLRARGARGDAKRAAGLIEVAVRETRALEMGPGSGAVATLKVLGEQ